MDAVTASWYVGTGGVRGTPPSKGHTIDACTLLHWLLSTMLTVRTCRTVECDEDARTVAPYQHGVCAHD